MTSGENGKPLELEVSHSLAEVVQWSWWSECSHESSTRTCLHHPGLFPSQRCFLAGLYRHYGFWRHTPGYGAQLV
jgi:hypothetical protein